MSQTAERNNQPPRETSPVPELLKKVTAILIRNWPMKLLALVLAVVLWAGLITQDPTLTRERAFRDVSVTVRNRDALMRRGYVVTSNLEELLSGVDILVDVPQMQYADAQAAQYDVHVDLSRLADRAGEQELTIRTNASSGYGEVTRVSPSTIQVTVEEYVSHGYIPVNVVLTGEAPEDFYVDSPQRDPSWITVSGPRSLVEQVDRAEVWLDLSQLPAREGTVEKALEFVLVGADGEVISSDMLQVTRDSVLRERIGITVELYAKRDIDVLSAQLYTGMPAEGYAVTDVYVTPAYVTVAGKKSVVDTVSLVQPSRLLSISGAKDTVTGTVNLSRPQNLEWISANQLTVTVVIQPENQTMRIGDVPVKFTGLQEGWQATPARLTADASVTGIRTWVTGLTAEDLQMTCDLTGLTAGTYEVPVICTIADSEGQAFIVETEPQTIQVVLEVPASAEE